MNKIKIIKAVASMGLKRRSTAAFITSTRFRSFGGVHSLDRPGHSKRNFRTIGEVQSDESEAPDSPGSKAFSDVETAAITDLFFQFAHQTGGGGVDEEGTYLEISGVKQLLHSIGEKPSEQTLADLFLSADKNNDNKLHLTEFLMAADTVLAGAPASTVWVIGGPGSGKGMICGKLSVQCGAVHVSSGAMLRDEVASGTYLGREVAEIMKKGQLVCSAAITTILRRRMREHPGRRILLDGFPRSLQNANDFADQCGKPELALFCHCDDTTMIERILKRAEETDGERADDNIQTALKRIKAYHKAERPVVEWLKDNCVPIVRLDCTGSQEVVWNQLLAIGRLMRSAGTNQASK